MHFEQRAWADGISENESHENANASKIFRDFQKMHGRTKVATHATRIFISGKARNEIFRREMRKAETVARASLGWKTSARAG